MKNWIASNKYHIITVVFSIIVTMLIGWVMGIYTLTVSVYCVHVYMKTGSLKSLIQSPKGKDQVPTSWLLYTVWFAMLGVQIFGSNVYNEISIRSHTSIISKSLDTNATTKRISCDSVSEILYTNEYITSYDVNSILTLSGILFNKMFSSDTSYIVRDTTKEIIKTVTTYDLVNICMTDTTLNLFQRNKTFNRIARTYMTNWKIVTDTILTDLKGNMCNILSTNCFIKISKSKSIPYSDKNLYLIQMSNFIVYRGYLGNRLITKDTVYKNRSSKLSDYDLKQLFSTEVKTKARWKHNINNSQYTVSFIDGTKELKAESKSEAKNIVTNVCKDKSTIAGKLIYTEFDACIKYAKIDKSYKKVNTVCGYSKPSISYYRGVVASRPNSCKLNADWGWKITKAEFFGL